MQNEVKQQETPTVRKLITVSDWPKYHSWPPQGGLRHLIFHKRTNGFAAAFKKVGRTILIDEAEFFRIIDNQNGGGE
jgi:hypothetical protein